MQFDVLNEVEQRFGELALFYALLHGRPGDAIGLILSSDSYKTRKKEREQDRKEVLEARAKLPRLHPHRITSQWIRPGEEPIWDERWILPLKEEPEVAPVYRFSVEDVTRYIWFERWAPLGGDDQTLTALRHELGKAGNEVEASDRTVRLKYFRALLDSLTDSLSQSFPVSDSSLVQDWPSVVEEAQKLAQGVQRVTDKYRAAIAPYMPATTPVAASATPPPIIIPPVESFDELFIEEASIETYLQALREVTPPVLDTYGGWIGRKGSKSVLIAWVEVLEAKKKIQFVGDRKHLSELLNARFPGLNLGRDASMFRKRPPIQGKYVTDFKILIK